MNEPQTESFEPLTEEEIEELDSFLASDVVPDDCMDLETLDGFLAGLVIASPDLPESKWLPWVWNDEGDAARVPSFENDDQREHILTLIRSWREEIVWIFENEPHTYAPFLYAPPEEDDDDFLVAQRWAQGFVAAIGLNEADWKGITSDEERAEWVFPIVVLGALPDDPDYGEAAEDAAYREELLESVPACVETLWRHFDSKRRGPKRNAEQPGRNDPCHCGSGKKYKNCHGA